MTTQYKFNISPRHYLFGTLLLLITATGCKKFVDIAPPTTQISSDFAFSNDGTATSIMTGMYADMMSTSGNFASGPSSLSMLEGLAADELKNYLVNGQGAQLQQFYVNNVDVNTNNFWSEFYERIYLCNLVLEGVNRSSSLSQGVKQQLQGEAKFMRALVYFYAVNTYGDVPMPLTTDYKTNNTLSRTPKDKVYDQIIADLKDAQALMGDPYFKGVLPGTTERARPNKGAATALLARVYLFRKDWANAEAQATAVINNAAYQLEPDMNNAFLVTSKEAIWQLQTVITDNLATYDGQYFILSSVAPGSSNQIPVALSTTLLNTFEQGDARKVNWINSTTINNIVYYYPYKYKKNISPTLEYVMVLRLAEQYLIRAEARAQQGNLIGAASAQSDLDAIRTRASLPGTTATDKDAMLAAIAHERRVELFTEWGHRWFDLVRTDKADEVMTVETTLKGGSWSTDHKLLPVPFDETQINPNIKQNPGYNQ